MLLIVWQFRPAPGREEDFVRAYGADGAWAALFRKAKGYHESVLAEDAADSGRFLVLDWWESESSFEAFKSRYSTEYAALDRTSEPLCAEERPLGRFVVPPPRRGAGSDRE